MEVLHQSLLIVGTFLLMALGPVTRAHGEESAAELFCTISENGQNLVCQTRDRKNGSKTFADQDILSFIDRSSSGGAYITVKSKKGFERTFEIDPAAAPFVRYRDSVKSAVSSEIAKIKLDIFTEIEKKAVQVSNELDKVIVHSDILKYDPSIATDKCKSAMRALDSGASFDKSLESLKTENRVLSFQLTSLIKAFEEPNTCMTGVKLEVTSDGSIDANSLENLPRAFRARCKRP
jgi:hypothetical protein